MFLKRSRVYPSLAYFTVLKNSRGYAARIWRNILKILIFMLLCLFIALYLIMPDKGNENTVLIVEMTPRVSSHFDLIMSRIEDMKDTMNIVRTVKTGQGLHEKADIISEVMSNMHLLSSDRIMLLTDRDYGAMPFTVINVRLPEDVVTITGAGNIITFYSSIEDTMRLSLHADYKLQYSEQVNAHKGYNYIRIPPDICYDSIAVDSAGLVLYETVCTESYFINDRTGLKLIDIAMHALDYSIHERSNFILSIKDDIERGIVFSQYGKTYVKAGERSYQGYNILHGIGMEGLHYERLDNYSGNAVMRSDAGENLIVRKGDVFYVNIPADTGMSNLFMLPEGIVILDLMIRALNNQYSAKDTDLMHYQRESLNTGDRVKPAGSHSRGSKRLFGLLAILTMMALLIL